MTKRRQVVRSKVVGTAAYLVLDCGHRTQRYVPPWRGGVRQPPAFVKECEGCTLNLPKEGEPASE